MSTKRNANEGRGGLGYCAVVLAFTMSGACSDIGPITGPGLPSPAAPAPAGSWIVRGVVFEDLPVDPDERPGPGVPVRVFAGGRVVEVTSGADGSFVADVPETAPFVRVVAPGPLFFTPCPAIRWAGEARAEAPLEVRVVSGAVLSKTGSPVSYSADRVAWGSVSERTSAGIQPISGATVTMLGTAQLENPLAVTLTDARGFYTICFPSRSGNYNVEVRKDGYAPAFSPPVIGWDFETTDFVLTRR